MKSKFGKILCISLLLLALAATLASCEKVKFQVDFTVDGEVYASIDVKNVKNTKMPKRPTKDGYTFAGWYNGETRITELPADNTEKLILTAKWEPAFTFDLNPDNTYTITSYRGTERELSIPREFEGVAITAIGSDAFRGCSRLTKITISDSITNIGTRAFESCTGLTSVTIGSGVTRIEKYAFANCYKLVEVYNLSSIYIIPGPYQDDGYVGYCAKDIYTSLTEPSKLNTTSDGYIFYEDTSTVYLIGYAGEDTELTLPYKYEKKSYELYAYAFYGYKELTDIDIPKTITTISERAFSGCEGLTSITIPSSITSFENYAFAGCTGLTDITVPDSVTAIDEGAFASCTALTSIIIPDSITSISRYIFHNCGSLTSITIPDSVTSIDSCAFQNCISLTSITIPSSVTRLGSYIFYGCEKLDSIIFEDTSTWYTTTHSEYYGGTVMDVTDSTKNVGVFQLMLEWLWYKK